LTSGGTDFDVLIVGGGFSGAAAAIHLLGESRGSLRVGIVERGASLGRGVAYGVRSPIFRLNVAACRMSVDPRRPDDFARWASADGASFLPRALYGDYVEARLREATSGPGGALTVHRGTAIRLSGRDLVMDDGRVLSAARFVLATGISTRLAPSGLAPDARIVDAWDEARLGTLPRSGHLLVLGAGLSALDVIHWLDAHEFEGCITVLSRHGLLPRPHLEAGSSSSSTVSLDASSAPRDLRGLLAWTRHIVRDHEQNGLPWQRSLDALRALSPSLWRRLSPRDRARFVRSVRPYWDALRHRAPRDSLERVDALRHSGRLTLDSGSLTSCVHGSAGLETTLRLAGKGEVRQRFSAIVRCIGPALTLAETDAPLLHSLVDEGRAALDPAGLGIVTNDEGNVVAPGGSPDASIFALGALCRASSWETTSVPEIAAHALALAGAIVG
jgi:uncharacterized NAD(P)/FAD-binding protein YdhS